jgi:hypothetical protein
MLIFVLTKAVSTMFINTVWNEIRVNDGVLLQKEILKP